MIEHFTEALVLENEINGELDARITLYTRDLGKIIAKAKSARKTTSKLNGHLQPLNFINCRLIEKNGLQIVDALTAGTLTLREENKIEKDFASTAMFLRICQFIKDMTFEFHPDQRLWFILKRIINFEADKTDEKDAYCVLLKIFGFDPECADCVACQNKTIRYFSKNNHCFLCADCAGKADKNDLVLVKWA